MRTRSHQSARSVWRTASEKVIWGSNWARFDQSRTTHAARKRIRIFDRSQNDIGLRVGRSWSLGRLAVATVGAVPAGTGLDGGSGTPRPGPSGGSGIVGTGWSSRSVLIASLLGDPWSSAPGGSSLLQRP